MMAAVIDFPPPPGAGAEDWAHFDIVLGLTADLLPVVSNPRAVVAPDSTLKAVGKVPSRYNGARQAVGIAKWTEHTTTPQEISGWSRERDLGICIQTRRVRALDVDVDDPELAALIHASLAHLKLPMRSRSNAAKFLLAFELPGELYKRRIKCASGMVEFLATGQQFIAVGTHPSGVRYEWADGLPDAFPVLSLEQFESLWSALAVSFGVEAATESQASVKHQKLADVMTGDPVANFLLSTNRVKRAERDGRLHIVCPFEDDHTSDSGDTATTYWPAHTGGYVNGHFHCLHAHCEHRVDQEFLDAIEYVNPDLSSEFAAIADAGAVVAAAAPQDVRADAPDAAKPARFAAQPAHLFAAGANPEWIIKGVLPRADLGVIFGESGSGKTFAILDMAVDIAMGTPWRGMRTRQARVVYIVAEGSGGFRMRLKAIAQQRGIALQDLPLAVIADAPNLMEKQDALDVAKSIHAAGGADLVIVDTFAQVMPGANENAGEDVGRALAHCKGIRRATGALVMLVHHSGKDSSRGARGWSGLRAAADVEMEVIEADGARSLTITKQKDGEGGAEFAFRLESVVVGIDADGEEQCSCVVQHAEGQVRRAPRERGPKGAVERLVLQAMKDTASLADGAVELLDLKAAVARQMPFDPSENKRDRRSFIIGRAVESLIAGRRIAVSGTTLRMVQE